MTAIINTEAKVNNFTTESIAKFVWDNHQQLANVSNQAVFTYFALDGGHDYSGRVRGSISVGNKSISATFVSPYYRDMNENTCAWRFQKDHFYEMVSPYPVYSLYKSNGWESRFHEENARWWDEARIASTKPGKQLFKDYSAGTFWQHAGVFAVVTANEVFISRDFDAEMLKTLGFREEEIWVPCSMSEAYLDTSSCFATSVALTDRTIYPYKKGGWI